MKLRTLIPVSLFSALCFFGVTDQTYAQNDDALLPEISPQDIEIRGEFSARFLGLNRQPILGFDPNLQVYQIDPDRMPFMETGDQVVANLPVSELSRPAPPTYSGLNYAEEINMFARAGVGSYTSPEVNFWGVSSINTDTYIGGDLDLSSSDGHLDDQRSSFRFLDASAEYGTRVAEKTELRIHGGVQSDFNYSADFNNTGAMNGVRMDHEGFNGGVELSRFKNDIAGWKLQGNIRSFSTEFGEDEEIPSDGIDELTYNGSVAKRWALGNPNETLALKAGGRGGSYEPQNQDSQQWGTLQGGVAYERLFNYRTNVHVEANAYYVTDVTEDSFYPGGLLKVDHWFGDRLKVTGKAEGKPHVNTVEQLHERNRFLGVDNVLDHSYTFDVTGEASIKYYRGSKLHGGVTYSNTEDYRYFTPTTISSPVDGGDLDTYTVNYQNATNFKLFAGITHQLLPERFWVSGQFYIQNPELDSGNKVPFEENWGVNASVSFKPIDRITIKGWADYVGERETGVNDNTLGDFLLLGSQLDVEVTDNFGAYVKLINMTDQAYQVWQGYPERPFQVYGGLTLKF